MANHPIRHSSTTATTLDRRDRHQLKKMDADAALTRHEMGLRTGLAQAQMIADTAVAQTAMACVAGSASFAATLRDAAPEVAEALNFLQAKHAANLAQRMDDFSWRS